MKTSPASYLLRNEAYLEVHLKGAGIRRKLKAKAVCLGLYEMEPQEQGESSDFDFSPSQQTR